MDVTLPPQLTPEGLDVLLASLEDTPSQAPLVLQGSSAGTFSTGMDLQRYARERERSVIEPLERYAACLVALRRAPCPTIAWVDGPAIGGGWGLAATCDIVLVGPQARFGLPEATFGLVPGMVVAAISERVSRARLRRMCLEASTIDRPLALEWGIADAAVDDGRALSRWKRRLSRLAPGVAPVVRRAIDDTYARRVERGCSLTADLLSQPDVRERVRRFMDEGIAPWEPLEDV